MKSSRRDEDWKIRLLTSDTLKMGDPVTETGTTFGTVSPGEAERKLKMLPATIRRTTRLRRSPKHSAPLRNVEGRCGEFSVWSKIGGFVFLGEGFLLRLVKLTLLRADMSSSKPTSIRIEQNGHKHFEFTIDNDEWRVLLEAIPDNSFQC